MAAQIICNVLVVIFYGEELFSIGEVKVINEKEVKLFNGVLFRSKLKILLKYCINARLSQYLERLYLKNFDFNQE